MFRGFDKTTGEFTTIYNSMEKDTIKRLSEIEREDANRCASCGGEDCVCCDFYWDRKRWVTSDVLFSEPTDEDRAYEDYLGRLIDDCEDEDFDAPKEKCDKCEARFCCDWRKE